MQSTDQGIRGHARDHAYLIGDHFAVLSLGRMSLNARRDEITLDHLIREMAGGSELTALAHGYDTLIWPHLGPE